MKELIFKANVACLRPHRQSGRASLAQPESYETDPISERANLARRTGKQGDNEKLSGTGVIGALKNSGGLWEAEESLFEELGYKNGEIGA